MTKQRRSITRNDRSATLDRNQLSVVYAGKLGPDAQWDLFDRKFRPRVPSAPVLLFRLG